MRFLLKYLLYCTDDIKFWQLLYDYETTYYIVVNIISICKCFGQERNQKSELIIGLGGVNIHTYRSGIIPNLTKPILLSAIYNYSYNKRISTEEQLKFANGVSH